LYNKKDILKKLAENSLKERTKQLKTRTLSNKKKRHENTLLNIA
jgi:hypothetical protein